jgi:two-component system, sensor histidine kinase
MHGGGGQANLLENAVPRRRQPRPAPAAERRAAVRLGARPSRRLAEGQSRASSDQIDSALDSVEGLLEALLEISKLDAGAVTARTSATVPLAETMRRMRAEFTPS